VKAVKVLVVILTRVNFDLPALLVEKLWVPAMYLNFVLEILLNVSQWMPVLAVMFFVCWIIFVNCSGQKKIFFFFFFHFFFFFFFFERLPTNCSGNANRNFGFECSGVVGNLRTAVFNLLDFDLGSKKFSQNFFFLSPKIFFFFPAQ
jgi:hypothetical protein